VRPYVVRDNDRSRRPHTSFLPSRATSPARGPRSSRKRYRISCVYLGMRDRAARNSIRRSRTKDSLVLQDWAGSVRLVLCVRTARMIEERIYEGADGSPSPVTSFISGRYASRLLDLLSRKRRENRKSQSPIPPTCESIFSFRKSYASFEIGLVTTWKKTFLLGFKYLKI